MEKNPGSHLEEVNLKFNIVFNVNLVISITFEVLFYVNLHLILI